MGQGVVTMNLRVFIGSRGEGKLVAWLGFCSKHGDFLVMVMVLLWVEDLRDGDIFLVLLLVALVSGHFRCCLVIWWLDFVGYRDSA